VWEDVDASERLWNIYKILKKDGMELDVPFASRLISYLLCVRALDNDETDLSSPVTFTEPVELGSSSPPLNLQLALIVLEEMENSENSSKKPDLRIYKSVIQGYILVNDLVSATSIVLRMVDAYMNGSNAHAKPNEFVFRQVVAAWIRYGDLIKATLFLNKMRELYVLKRIPIGLSLSTYKTLISTWKQSSHPKKEVYLSSLYAQVRTMDDNSSSNSHLQDPRMRDGGSDAQLNIPHDPSMSSPPTFLATATAAAAARRSHAVEK
jgi:hypothetical protein